MLPFHIKFRKFPIILMCYYPKSIFFYFHFNNYLPKSLFLLYLILNWISRISHYIILFLKAAFLPKTRGDPPTPKMLFYPILNLADTLAILLGFLHIFSIKFIHISNYPKSHFSADLTWVFTLSLPIFFEHFHS
jgi:hypothetical protein